MPSMVHVGDEGLRAIYAHVMEVSKGAVAKKQEKGDPYAAAPTHLAWITLSAAAFGWTEHFTF
jgi:hypothetical protein